MVAFASRLLTLCPFFPAQGATYVSAGVQSWCGAAEQRYVGPVDARYRGTCTAGRRAGSDSQSAVRPQHGRASATRVLQVTACLGDWCPLIYLCLKRCGTHRGGRTSSWRLGRILEALVSSSRAGLVAGLYLKQQVRAYTLLGFGGRFLCGSRPLGLCPHLVWLVTWLDQKKWFKDLICRVPLAAGGGGRASRLFFLSRRPRCPVEVSTTIS